MFTILATASENEVKRVIVNLNDGASGKDGVIAKTLQIAMVTPIC